MPASSRSLQVFCLKFSKRDICANFPFFGLLAESSLVKSVCGSGALRTQNLRPRAFSSLFRSVCLLQVMSAS